ncbi:MAG: hypothetical protein ACREUQ_01350, partial [Burkholderiales bacterium]
GGAMIEKPSIRTGALTRRLALTLAGAVGLAVLAGCAGYTPPPPETAAQKQAMANFNLGQCTQIEPGLYRCPASDKAICTPGFARTDVECVQVTKDGVVIRQPGI